MVPGRPLYFATAMPSSGRRAPAAGREPHGPPDEDRGQSRSPREPRRDRRASRRPRSSRSTTRTARRRSRHCGEIRPWSDLPRGDAARDDWRARGARAPGCGSSRGTITSPTLARAACAHPRARVAGREVAPVRACAGPRTRARCDGEPSLPLRIERGRRALARLGLPRRAGRATCATRATSRRGGTWRRRAPMRLVRGRETSDHHGRESGPPAAAVERRTSRVASLELGAESKPGPMPRRAPDTSWLARSARPHAGAAIVIAGEAQPPAVHALSHAMNARARQRRHDGGPTESVEVEPRSSDHVASIARARGATCARARVRCCSSCSAATRCTTRRRTWLRRSARRRSGLRVHLSLYEDETSELCHWHVPADALPRGWSDARAYGRHGVHRPAADRAALRRPRRHTRLSRSLDDAPGRTSYEIVREYWLTRGHRTRRLGAAADDGFVARRRDRRDRRRRGRWRGDAEERGIARGRAPSPEGRSRSRSARSNHRATGASRTTAGCRSCPSR